VIGRLLAASLRRRGRQFLLMGTAVAVAAATVSTLVGFLVHARGGLGGELAAFGPNLLVRPQVGAAAGLPPADAAEVRALAGVERVAAVVELTDGRLAVEPDWYLLHPTWQAEGLQVSDLTVPAGALAAAADRFEVRADANRLEAVAAAIESRVAGAEARPLLRVSAAERQLVRRVGWLLAFAAAVSCLLALVSVGAATTALVGERRREVGLFVALGYTGRRVARLFALEFLTAALVAGLCGAAFGVVAAGRLAVRVLGRSEAGVAATAAATGWSLPVTALVAVLVVGAAMTLALKRVEAVDPARVLRGE
jgi:FtsX-like permease family